LVLVLAILVEYFVSRGREGQQWVWMSVDECTPSEHALAKSRTLHLYYFLAYVLIQFSLQFSGPSALLKRLMPLVVIESTTKANIILTLL
jgi:hypothetical protein